MLRHFLTVIFALSLVLPAPGSERAQMGNAVPVSPTLRLLASGEDGVTLDLLTPGYLLTPETIQGHLFQRLTLPGAAGTSEPGKPQVPMVTAMIGVPADAKLEVRLLLDDSAPLPEKYSLSPAPRPAPLQDDLQPGEWVTEADASAYAQNSRYPQAPAQLSGDAWMRDQRVATISLYPFQYNPAQGELLWHRHLRVEVLFIRGQAVNPLPGAPQASSSAFEPVLRQSLLNYDSARLWRQLPSSSSQVSAFQKSAESPQVTSPSLKISIDQDGIYRLTYANLQAAGLDVANVDPATFHMTSQGQDVAIAVDNLDGDPHKFSANESVVFYGQKFRGNRLSQVYAGQETDWLTFTTQITTGAYATWTPKLNAAMFEKYTDENVYWLSWGGAPGPRIDSMDGAPGGAATPSSYRATVHAEQSHYWKTTLFTSEDTWFWDRIQTGSVTTRTYTTTLTAIASGTFTATLSGEAVAEAYNDTAYPDHDTQVYLNNPPNSQPLVDETWDGKSRYHFEVHLPESQLVDGENKLSFVVHNTPSFAGTSDIIYFDWFAIEYNRQFQAEGDELAFPGEQGGPWKYAVSGFSAGLTPSQVGVLDITQPLTPTQISNATLSAGTLSFQVADSSDAQFFTGKIAEVPAASLSLYQPPDFSQPADYLFITHHDFLTATQTLADYRASQGLSTRIVDVADLYDEFNYGIYNPIAIKNFLAYTFANWVKPPTYVLLVGDGHWNFKGYSSSQVYGGYDSSTIYMPPNLVWVDPWQGEVDSANWLATVVGNDPLPDVYIGRLPVNSVAELDAATAKIMAYEQAAPQPWQQRMLFIADNTPDPAGDFVAFSENIISDYVKSGFQADRIYEDNYLCTSNALCPPVNQAITQTLNLTGTLLMNYVGHASLNRWSSEQILVNADISSLANGNRLPIVLSMTCLDGYWIYPGQTGLIEDMVRAADKGAVSAFSPTGLGVSTGHDALQHGFYDSLFKDGDWVLGPASLSAKMNLYATNSNFDLLQTFTIFGDPALRIPSPYKAPNLDPTASAQMGILGSSVTYAIQVKNTSPISDTFDLSLSGNTWTAIALPSLGPLPPGATFQVDVTVTIPKNVGEGDSDAVTLTVQSRGDKNKQATAVLTTTALNHRIYLPLATR